MYNKNNHIYTNKLIYGKQTCCIESKVKKERNKQRNKRDRHQSAKLRLEKIMEVGYTGQLRDRIRKVKRQRTNCKAKFYIQVFVHREIYANNCPTRCNYI